MHPCATLVTFQLKYCERCGRLWLRPHTAVTPYCPTCEQQFVAGLPLRTRPADRKSIKSVCAAGAARVTECTA